jgi:hypothetical protein
MTDVLMSCVGVCLFGFALVHVFTGWETISNTNTLLQLALPVWLTVGFLPYVYAVALYADYETAFKRIKRFAETRSARLRAKLVLFSGLHVRARELHVFTGPWQQRLAVAPTFKDARGVIKAFRQERSRPL